ncbi:hypothetical protein [Chlorogloeopsis fritschii]|nr:hypothetical protein [Chlorogloeopsis fritschii]
MLSVSRSQPVAGEWIQLEPQESPAVQRAYSQCLSAAGGMRVSAELYP